MNYVFRSFLLLLILFTNLFCEETYQAEKDDVTWNTDEGLDKAAAECKQDLVVALSEQIAFGVETITKEDFEEKNDEESKEKFTAYTRSVTQSNLSGIDFSGPYNIEKPGKNSKTGTFSMRASVTLSDSDANNIRQQVKKKIESLSDSYKKSSEIKDLLNYAVESEKELRIGDAIESYTEVLLLMKNTNDLELIDFPDTEKPISENKIIRRIKSICNSLNFEIYNTENLDDREKNVYLNVTYEKRPVHNLNFSYLKEDEYFKGVKVGSQAGLYKIKVQIGQKNKNIKLRINHLNEYRLSNDSIRSAYKELELFNVYKTPSIKQIPIIYYFISILVIFLITVLLNNSTKGKYTNSLFFLWLIMVIIISVIYFKYLRFLSETLNI